MTQNRETTTQYPVGAAQAGPSAGRSALVGETMAANMNDRRTHWDRIYEVREPEDVSWYQENPARSCELIARHVPDPHAAIIDVGGGASRLVDRLVTDGRTDLTVLDISNEALVHARTRLESQAAAVHWITADVIGFRPSRRYTLWHDRAVLHFLTAPDDRKEYVASLEASVAAGGHVIIATFAVDGPDQCSGLPVRRYSPELLIETLGDGFIPLTLEHEVHETPAGNAQHFLYGCFRRAGTHT